MFSNLDAELHIATGSTPQRHTPWRQYIEDDPAQPGIYVTVDTSKARFTTTPNYVASIGGFQKHWEVCGSSAIYDAKPYSFTMYLRWSWNPPGQEQPPLTPDDANNNGWFVTWIGIAPR